MRFQLEQAFNGVERVMEYMSLPPGTIALRKVYLTHPEPPRHLATPLDPAWPTAAGTIKYTNVVMKYAPDLEAVLRGVSFMIKARDSASAYLS